MNHIILAGAGHAHLHVLKSLVQRRWSGVGVTLLTPQPRQIYSGMVPGWMAGHYTLDQCTADMEPLARAASVNLRLESLSAIHANTQTIETGSGATLHYDALSINTGASVDIACLTTSGARCLSIRPLERFVAEWRSLLDATREKGTCRLAVVGGGAAGVELALAAQYRLAHDLGSANVHVSLITGDELLPGHSLRIRKAVRRCLNERGVSVLKARATGCPTGLLLDDGNAVKVDAFIAATGVQPPAWLTQSGLALATDGFIAVGKGQQSVSHSQVFAGGDIASRIDHPHAKSGVYAVRSGPILAHNLHRILKGEPLMPNTPQRRSLYLLATGPKDAVMSWNRITVRASWVWRWKDWIDQQFVRQYQLSSPSANGGKNGTF